MKRALRRAVFSLCLCGTLLATHAQDHFAYAVTGAQRQTGEWSHIRKIDLQTGLFTNFVFDGSQNDLQVMDARTRKVFSPVAEHENQPVNKAPFWSGVAAMAFDRAHQRLYFTPMFEGQLRYLDLRTQKLFYITNQAFMSQELRQPDGAKVVTRMVIAPDGYGYGITNDGMHMSRFSTGRKPEIVQMGALTDAPENKAFSIHSAKAGFGGDMVADDAGNLLIITAFNHVFKVTPANRVATYIATISGLPKKFTVNGAVVNGNGQLLVSSGVDESDYFVVDPQTWTAIPFKGTGVYRSSDLANGNFLQTRPTATAPELAVVQPAGATPASSVRLYPNPATNGVITLQFHKTAPGNYNIDLVDTYGRMIQSQRVTIAFKGQTQTIALPKAAAKSVFVVRVTDRNRLLAHEEKVVVQ